MVNGDEGDQQRESKKLYPSFTHVQTLAPDACSACAVYAAFARKRTVRRGLWRQPNVASMAEQLALSDYKTPAARRATRS